MDTLTQITLGAAVGEAVLGKKVGNKAILWGAIAATIPDLDVLAMPLLNETHRLVFHRSISHSILFIILLTPLLGYFIHKISWDKNASRRDWTMLSFWSLITHPLLDCFTTYGTQILWPFSSYPVAFNTIFVVDPLYTAPFLTCVTAAMFFKRTSTRRRVINYIGITVSSLYLLVTVIDKLYVNSTIEASLKLQGVTYTNFMTTPTPLNNLLWLFVATDDSTIYEGYYSILDSRKQIEYRSSTRNQQILTPYKSNWQIQQLIRFSKGFYRIIPGNNTFRFADARFGRLGFNHHESVDYVFIFQVSDLSASPVRISRISPLDRLNWELGYLLFERMKGL